MLSFDRPELSPCLAKLTDKDAPGYLAALAIIKAGKAMLEQCPEADQPGFVPCATDQRREAKYAARRLLELRNRQAIKNGIKVYDQNTLGESP